MPIFELFYLLNTALLAIYGVQSLYLTLLARRGGGETPAPRWDECNDSACPRVTVQLPVYNERHVIARLIDAVAAFDWPRDRLQIQVLDDSTDDTTQIIARRVAHHRRRGLDIQHVRRGDREGYKAGALNHGLAGATGAFIAIFDADFAPAPDFLRRTMPVFQDPSVGCLQARWGHLNAGASRLTMAQSLGMDGHFVVEQRARAGLGAFLNFNGTAGIWRRRCMEEAGGWAGDTLTEDLDLSYRAQLAGWRIAFLPDVIVPAEIPVQVDAFKRQQFRWAKGSLQTAGKLLSRVWRSSHPLWRKNLATVHLTSYTVHPLMVINLLCLLPMMSSYSPVLKIASLFALTAVGPPFMYWTAMAGTRPLQRLGRLGVLLALGTGLSLNNTRAALEAALRVPSEFKRTPKFAVTDQSKRWQTSAYVLPSDPIVWAELLLGLYAAGLLVYSLMQGAWWLLPWLFLYVSGYGYVVYLAFVQAWQKRAAAQQVTLASQEVGD